MDKEWLGTKDPAYIVSQSSRTNVRNRAIAQIDRELVRLGNLPYQELRVVLQRNLETFWTQLVLGEKERQKQPLSRWDLSVSGLISNTQVGVPFLSKAVLETPLPIVTTDPISPHSTTKSESTSIGFVPTATTVGTQLMTRHTVPKDLPITRNGSQKLWNGVRTIRTQG